MVGCWGRMMVLLLLQVMIIIIYNKLAVDDKYFRILYNLNLRYCGGGTRTRC